MSAIDLLKRVPEFSHLTSSQLAAIDDLAERRPVEKGEQLIREGDRAKRFFVVLSGKFTVLSAGKPIAEIFPGEPIGEIAFFAGGLRTSDVIAARDSHVLQFDSDSYERLSRQIPELSNQVLKALSQRLAAVAKQLSPLPPRGSKTVAIVPASGAELPQAFVDALTSQTDEKVDCIISNDPADEGDRDAWLRDREEYCERVFLLCPNVQAADDDGWFAFATRNCDSVCIIVDTVSDDCEEVASYERELLENAATCPVHVVLWSQNDSDRPHGSSRLLSERFSQLRHHVCGSSPETVKRWLRFLSGTAVGAVLCGGGALGTAHLGAVKALLEFGYEIDVFGGTSAGAAMAGALASQMPPDDIMKCCDEIFVSSKAMSKLSVPIHSILDHHAFDAQMEKHYGAWDIEDLPLNYFAVSTSLTTNHMHVHRTGPLWKTVRASGSIPAILPPLIQDDGEVLIDGALVDNLPVGVMRQIKAGPNIILNFQDQPEWRVHSDYSKMPTRLQALWRFVTRKKKPFFPSIAAVLSRTMVVTTRRREAALDLGEDILIEMPTLPGMGVLDWSSGKKQYDLAYRTVKSILERAKVDKNDSLPRRLSVLRAAAAELSAKD